MAEEFQSRISWIKRIELITDWLMIRISYLNVSRGIWIGWCTSPRIVVEKNLTDLRILCVSESKLRTPWFPFRNGTEMRLKYIKCGESSGW